LGCGTGWVLAQAGSRHTLRVGFDFSFDQLLEGQRQFPDLRFVQGTGLTLPFAAASIDEVIGHVSLPYMNTRTALCEVHRVLAPGGTFFLTFHSFAYVRWRLLKDLRQGQWKDMLFMGYLTVNGLLNHFALPQAPWFRGAFETINTTAGVTRTARQVGFDTIRIEHQPGAIFFGVTGRKPDPQSCATPPEMAWSLSVVTQMKSSK